LELRADAVVNICKAAEDDRLVSKACTPSVLGGVIVGTIGGATGDRAL
jgi:hypothetical protein